MAGFDFEKLGFREDEDEKKKAEGEAYDLPARLPTTSGPVPPIPPEPAAPVASRSFEDMGFRPAEAPAAPAAPKTEAERVQGLSEDEFQRELAAARKQDEQDALMAGLRGFAGGVAQAGTLGTLESSPASPRYVKKAIAGAREGSPGAFTAGEVVGGLGFGAAVPPARALPYIGPAIGRIANPAARALTAGAADVGIDAAISGAEGLARSGGDWREAGASAALGGGISALGRGVGSGLGAIFRAGPQREAATAGAESAANVFDVGPRRMGRELGEAAAQAGESASPPHVKMLEDIAGPTDIRADVLPARGAVGAKAREAYQAAARNAPERQVSDIAGKISKLERITDGFESRYSVASKARQMPRWFAEDQVNAAAARTRAREVIDDIEAFAKEESEAGSEQSKGAWRRILGREGPKAKKSPIERARDAVGGPSEGEAGFDLQHFRSLERTNRTSPADEYASKNLKAIGSGEDRNVYDLGGGAVLKVSKPGTFRQSQAEVDLYLGLPDAARRHMPTLYEASPDRTWSIVEKVTPFKKFEDFDKVFGQGQLEKFSDAMHGDMSGYDELVPELQSAYAALKDLPDRYGVTRGEMLSIDNMGVSSDGTLKIIDTGDLRKSPPAPNMDLPVGTYAGTGGGGAFDPYEFAKGHNLKSIGKGSSRESFDLGDGSVLKVYHGRRAPWQSRYEISLYESLPEDLAHMMPEVRSADPGGKWMVVEKVEPIRSPLEFDQLFGDGQDNAFQHATASLRSRGKYSPEDMSGLDPRLQEYVKNAVRLRDQYGVDLNEAISLDNMGVSSDGSIKILDLGAGDVRAIQGPKVREIDASPPGTGTQGGGGDAAGLEDAYVMLDQLKRDIGKAQSIAERAGDNHARNQIRELYGYIQEHLEDEKVWGAQTAAMQKEVNDLWVPYLRVRGAYQRQLLSDVGEFEAGRFYDPWKQSLSGDQKKIAGLMNASDYAEQSDDLVIRGLSAKRDLYESLARNYDVDQRTMGEIQSAVADIDDVIQQYAARRRDRLAARSVTESASDVFGGARGVPGLGKLLPDTVTDSAQNRIRQLSVEDLRRIGAAPRKLTATNVLSRALAGPARALGLGGDAEAQALPLPPREPERLPGAAGAIQALQEGRSPGPWRSQYVYEKEDKPGRNYMHQLQQSVLTDPSLRKKVMGIR